MAVVAQETERKYQAAKGHSVPDLTGVAETASVVPREEVALDAVYHDTPDLRLAAAGITLRRRGGGDDEGWHLKLPAGPDTREEIRLPLGAQDAVPDELAALVRARTRGIPLTPVVRLRTLRRPLALLDRKGRELAVVTNDHVTAEPLGGERPGTPRAWSEIEVELGEAGRPALLDAVERRLAETGITRSPSRSKLATALGERVPPPTDPAPRRKRPATAGEAVLGYLREQYRALVEYDAAVRRDLPDSVHQTRIACRRARSALKTFRTVLDPEATRGIADGLRRLAGELGADRDREVLRARLYRMLDELPPEEVAGPVRARLDTWSERSRAATRARVLAALDSDWYLDLLASFEALLAAPPLLADAAAPPGRVLREAVLHDHRRLARRYERARTDEDRHGARKAAKRARYAAEAARPVLGGPAKKYAKRTHRVQDALGEYQDAVVTREALRELAGQAHAAGENAFTYGVLYTRAVPESAGRHAGKAWRRASRKGLRKALKS